MMQRCDWAQNELAIQYHDREWGVPLHDDQKLFEFLILEGAQAGLSWNTILRKRENYRAAFDDFDGVYQNGRGIRQFRFVYLAICRRHADYQCLGNERAGSSANSDFRANEQRFEKARI